MVYKVHVGVKSTTHLVFIITQIVLFLYTFPLRDIYVSISFTFVWLSNIKMTEDFLANTSSDARKIGNVSIIIQSYDTVRHVREKIMIISM